TIPWGDVSTAYHSTGIPNVEVYLPGSPRFIRSAKRANLIRPVLKVGFIQNLIKNRIAKTVKGPDKRSEPRCPLMCGPKRLTLKEKPKPPALKPPTVTASLLLAL